MGRVAKLSEQNLCEVELYSNQFNEHKIEICSTKIFRIKNVKISGLCIIEEKIYV